MADILSEFNAYLASPASYSNPSEELKARSLSLLKRVFDMYKKCAGEELEKMPGCTKVSTGPLPELYTEGLDSDQIWEQIQLMNQPVIKAVSGLVSGISPRIKSGDFRLLAASGSFGAGEDTDDEGTGQGADTDSSAEDSEGNQDVENDDDDIGSDFDISDEEHSGSKHRERTVRQSVVDDKFFKLSEMQNFLEMAEKNNEALTGSESEDDEDIDLFEDVGSESDGDLGGQESTRDLHYEEFFDPPDEEVETEAFSKSRKKKAKVTFSNMEEDSGSEEEGVGGGTDESAEEEERGSGSEEEFSGSGQEIEPSMEEGGKEDLSMYQRKKILLQKKIATLEEANLAEKSWKMAGEATAKKRPQNSLLEEDLAFDHMTRPPPVITEETTKTLEDIIKQRIMDRAWDDVERRVKPVEKPYDYSRSRPLEQEKSKLSLAEVYEQEYIKQTQEFEGEKEDKRHVEIDEMIKKLFVKLDALSNFHFTPKPPKNEVKVVTNIPAIQMEEVAPIATSDATLLAPEEIQAKSKRPEVGPTEKTATDKKRERRIKKKKKRLRNVEKKQRDKMISKLNPGLGNKYTRKSFEKKLKEREEGEKVDKSLSSSSRFFAQLQEQVKEQVKSAKGVFRSDSKRNRTSVQQYKL